MDKVWDEYSLESLKATTRQKRGKGLRINENKVVVVVVVVLFSGIVIYSILLIMGGAKVISNFGKLILLTAKQRISLAL